MILGTPFAQPLHRLLILMAAVPLAFLCGHGSQAGEDAPTATGELGEPLNIVFRGVATFTPDELRDALQDSPEFLLASHPRGPLDNYISSLRELVLRGYQHAGFADADVVAEYNKEADAVEVTVDEGSFYAAGDVNITGAKTLPVEAFIHRLTEPWPVEGPIPAPSESKIFEPSPSTTNAMPPQWLDETGERIAPEAPIWKKGTPVPFDELSAAELTEKVGGAMRDLGYFFAKFDAKIIPHPDTRTADLGVSIADEGPPGIVGDIVVTGNKRDTRDDILEFLQLKPGMSFDQNAIRQSKLRLWRSARYLNYEIIPELISVSATIRLRIEVTEYPDAPSLSGAFSEEESALLRFCSWLSEIRSRGDDVVIAIDNLLDAYQVRSIFSDQGALLTLKGSSHNANSANSFDILLTPSRIDVISTAQQAKMLAGAPRAQLQTNFHYLPEYDPEKGWWFPLSFGVSFHTSPNIARAAAGALPLEFDLSFAPAACISWAHLKDGQRFERNGVLTFAGASRGRLSVDPHTGRLVEFAISQGHARATLRVEHGAFAAAEAEINRKSASFPDKFNLDSPIDSAAAFLIEDALKGGPLAVLWFDNGARKERRFAAAVVDRIFSQEVLQPLNELLSQLVRKKRFTIPDGLPATADEAETASISRAWTLAFRVADALFPQESWPWTTAREAVFVVSGASTYTGLELQRIYESNEVGPIGYLTIAELLAQIDSPYSVPIAQRGLERLSAEDFRMDVALLLERDSAFARCFKRAAVALGHLSEKDIKVLAAVLPSDVASFLRSVSELVRAHPNDPLEAVLPAAFDTYWTDYLRAIVEAKLRELALPAAHRRSPVHKATDWQ